MTKTNSWLILLGIVVVVAAAIWFALRQPSVGVNVNASSTTTGTTSGATVTSPATPGIATPAPARGAATIVAPATGAVFVLGKQNTIVWSRATGSPNGSIYLVNAATGAVVGWIQQNLIATQSSFPWNTSEVFVSATSPSKKNLEPGSYVIKVSFNSPQYPTIMSGAFSVILPSQVVTPSEAITVRNYTATPSALSVKQGTKLVFTNDDSVDYQVTITSNGTFDLKPGATYTFNTAILAPGPYAFYSTAYPTLRTTVTVQ